MLIFIYGAKLPRSKKEIIKNPEELFLTLERHGVSLKSDPNIITGMMKSISRTDLVQMTQKYYGEYGIESQMVIFLFDCIKALTHEIRHFRLF